MKDDPINNIIKSKLPGYRVVEQQQRPAHLDAEAVTEVDALRAKFNAPANSVGSNSSDELITVEPENAPAGQDRSSSRKAVLVSKKDKRIVGMQG